jgi:pilus assembly protein CpaF
VSLLERLSRTPDETPQPQQAAVPLLAPKRSRGAQLRPDLLQAKARIHSQLVTLSSSSDLGAREEVRARITNLAETYVRTSSVAITQIDFDALVDSLVDDVLGLGPLEALLEDPEISEIMINNPGQVYVERRGRLGISEVVFESDRQLRLVIDRVVSSVGRRVDESSPMCDARLTDGSRVNVVIPPLAVKGACMSIRKFRIEKLTGPELVEFRSCSPDMLKFLEASVRARLNILVSGGTSSGKTTLLNVLSGFIPDGERIVTIEDAVELQLQRDHVITLESRPPNVEGTGEVPIRALLRNSLRMRPDRIIVGECRGGEALDMLQAMNTGHEGSMSTVHANTATDAISRLETMVLMGGAELPARAIQKQITAVDLIVQAQRLRGGARRIVSITELTGIQSGDVTHQELYTFRQLGVSADGAAYGYHSATGHTPTHLEHLRASGEDLSPSMFKPTAQPLREDLY